MNRCCILLLFTIYACDCYKFLVYSPIFGFSHINFMGAIADTLTEAGHNVTLLMPVMDFEQNKTGTKLTKNIIKLPTDPVVIEWLRHRADLLGKVWVMQPSIYRLMQLTQDMSNSFTSQCKRVFNNGALIKQLKEEKFDVGIAEMFSICGLGIFELMKIPATIATFAGVHSDSILEAIGEPIVPSYVPGAMSSAGDRMNFLGRLKNTIDVIFGKKFFKEVFYNEIAAFREKFGPDFKGFEQLASDASYVFTNSNPYLDYPRPMLHKTVPIGGITVTLDPLKNKLSEKWSAILNERNTTVLVSFGSVAKAIYMPDLYKSTLLKVFESMPDTTFIMKYEKEGSTIADHLPNVYLSTWVPQNALLADSRLTVFVTHGGLGSTTELAHLGKPAIFIPIFADQTRNAQMFVKHGGGIVLTKNDLKSPSKLRESLLKIFSDDSYSRNAKRLSEILLNQPISVKQLVIRHCEFAARFGRLFNLDPYGRHLSFMQYYLLDMVLVVVSVVIMVVYLSVELLKKCLSLKVKKD